MRNHKILMVTLYASILAVLSFNSVTLGQLPGIRAISLSPEEPVDGDDIVLTVRGDFPHSGFEWNNQDFLHDGNSLIIDLWCVELEMGQAEITPYQIQYQWRELHEGNYEVIGRIYTRFREENDFRLTGQMRIYFTVGDVAEDISISLSDGWNLTSSHISPAELDIRFIFSELVQREALLLVKDGSGRFYAPEFDFNSIPFWNFREGYLVKMAEADNLEIVGEPVSPDTPIPLQQNWNTIAYFPEEEVEAPEAFANIEQVLIIAKDGSGNFYRPEYNFSNMGELRQGRGYMVKVSEAVELIWNVS